MFLSMNHFWKAAHILAIVLSSPSSQSSSSPSLASSSEYVFQYSKTPLETFCSQAGTDFSPQTDHHSMMGSTKSPEDGGAVAASIFVAVAVYAVSEPMLFGRCVLISVRAFWCSAAFKPYCILDRVGGGRFH